MMIELLFPEEFPFGEPEYSKLSEKIQQLRRSIARKLNDEGKAELKYLSDTYLRQSNVAVRSAFTEGFRAAMELMRELEQRGPS